MVSFTRNMACMPIARPRTVLPCAHLLQVSEHTTRVHFHGAADGTQPLGASLPLEALLPACQPSAAAATLLAAVQARPVTMSSILMSPVDAAAEMLTDAVSGLQSALSTKKAVH